MKRAIASAAGVIVVRVARAPASEPTRRWGALVFAGNAIVAVIATGAVSGQLSVEPSFDDA